MHASASTATFPSRRRTSSHRSACLPWRATAWVACVASILFPLAAASAAPLEYKASYTVRVFGLRGELTLQQMPAAESETAGSGRDLWRFRSRLEAKGIAKLFVRGETVEDSLYELRADGRLRPVAVQVDDPIGDSTREVRFHWPQGAAAAVAASAQPPDGRADGVDEGEPFALDIPGETLDRALLMPAIALDLQAADGATDENGRPQLATAFEPGEGYRFTVVERGKLRQYFARLLGNEQLEGPDGPLDTLVFEHQRKGSSRATTFWLAPELGYLPVRIEQRKDDKNPHLRAHLKEFETVDEATTRTASSD